MTSSESGRFLYLLKNVLSLHTYVSLKRRMENCKLQTSLLQLLDVASRRTIERPVIRKISFLLSSNLLALKKRIYSYLVTGNS